MRGVIAVLLLLALVVPAAAADPVTQTFSAPADRVWATARAVLTQLGWDVEREDRSIGWITTESRRLEGEEYGVYAKGTRHRLTIHVKPAGTDRSTVSVQRDVFKRERILWIDKDEPVQVPERDVEKAFLAALAKSL